MSIEQLIADNTAALRELAEALRVSPAAGIGAAINLAPGNVAVATTPAKSDKPEKETKTKATPTVSSVQDSKPVVFEEVAEAARKLREVKGREALVEVLDTFTVNNTKPKKFSDLPESLWASAFDKVNKALES